MKTTAETLDRLRALLIHPDTGVNARMAAIEARDSVIMPRIPPAQVVVMNLPADVADDNLDFVYPAIFLCGDESLNENREKFAWFSGSIAVSIDVRVTADRPDALEESMHRYAEAVFDVLQDSQGQWPSGIMYDGRYTARYSAARLGGDNFLQSARISLSLDQHIS